MAYHFSFADNEIYSAKDVNNITKRLVTQGVADSFVDGQPYNISKMNELGALMYTSGVVPETVSTLKVTVDGETVLIHPGMAFFEDGAVIEIEEDGHVLSRIPGVANYVYLKNDLVNTNTCFPVCSSEQPTGDFVLLAEISENGVVTDKRTYATGKLGGYQSNAGRPMIITQSFSPQNLSETFQKTYDIGNNNYRYLFARMEGRQSYQTLGVYDFSDGSYVSFAGNKNDDISSYNCIMSTNSLLIYLHNHASAETSVELTDGVLKLDVKYQASLESYLDPFTVEMCLI